MQRRFAQTPGRHRLRFRLPSTILRRPALLAILLPASLAAAQSQWEPLNPVTGVQQQSDGVLLTMQAGVLRLQVCSDSIIRVTYATVPPLPSRPDYVVIKSDWAPVKWTFGINADAGTVILATNALKVTVARSTGVIAFSDASGARLVEEDSRKLTPERVNGDRTYRAESFLNIYGSPEALYGLGQHQAGVWNYRGESVELAQENTNIAVPLLVSSKGYGLFWNNTSRSRFDNRFEHSLYITSEVADTIDYYFIYGPELDKVIAGYRELTGEAPMFGRWAYGFWQCKNRYKSQDEILAAAHQYRELHIPVDNIVQDWFWWNRKGEHVFNSNYPDPKGMVDDLHRNHFHLMISVWPFFEPPSAAYDEMDRRGWFIAKTLYSKPPYHAQGMARRHERGSARLLLAVDERCAVQDRHRRLVARHR